MAYHAGVLAALQHDLGWDAREADVVVGTSAGSLVGALLRIGVPPTDLAALTVGSPALEADRRVQDAVTNRPSCPPIDPRQFLRLPRLPGPRAVAGLTRLWWARGPSFLGSLGVLLPDGSQQLAPHLGFIDEVFGDRWPEDTLLLCAARRSDCHRTVFGQGGTEAGLSQAIAASCAVPGYFAGVRIGDGTYVDGGVISPTNADVLRRHDLDLAIVVSPMTGGGWWPTLPNAIRQLCRRSLELEVRTLRRHHVPTVVIEPGRDVLSHMTADFMADSAVREIVREAFMDTGSQILRDPVLNGLRVERPHAVAA
jgi:NTE family protein